ncbi:MAG: nucleoside-diphosphate kinase [Flavobacteriaceae bacterium]|jgi:nucleoside-diphosphate kinase|nr:nucleoside-diphosphate kinase [Flavobacteriaceae bacterium]|tara:strand:+ start:533 stop:952 length:420 start_codon:yes stop_codon:yes gene_type:complete
MKTNQTFTIIKPDAVANGHTGAILSKIAEAGFRFKALKMTRLSQTAAEAFYAVHNERPFFNNLVSFMASGPIVAAVLEKDNAVDDFRTLIGTTDPEAAAEGTIRKSFATSVGENAIHGSDSDENAVIEIAFHFTESEQF